MTPPVVLANFRQCAKLARVLTRGDSRAAGLPTTALQIRVLKFQSSNSNSRELELTNLLGLVLGCIEAKF